MNRTFIRRSERFYGFLLKFYPKSYRQQFEEEMKYVFSESLKDSYANSGERGIFDLPARTIVDAGKSIVIQHLDHQKGSGKKEITAQNKQKRRFYAAFFVFDYNYRRCPCSSIG